MTDGGFTAPDGSNDASRLVGTGSWYLNYSTNLSIVGTYTIVCWVKSNTGLSQTFRLCSIGNFHDSPDLTATTSWQPFVYTASYTASTDTPGIRAVSGGASNDLLICDIQLLSGTYSTGQVVQEALAGHMYLAVNAINAPVTVDSTGADLSTGGWGTIQFPTSTTLTNGYTCMALISPQGDGGSRIVSFLSSMTTYTDFAPCYANAGQSYNAVSTTNVTNMVGTNYDDQFTSAGYHMFCSSWGGAATDGILSLDDITFFTSPVVLSPTAPTIADLYAALAANVLNYGNYKLQALAIWPFALTAAQKKTAYLALKAKFSGTTITRPAAVICAEGDSITATQAFCYPYKYIPNRNAGSYVTVMGFGGATLASMSARATKTDAILPSAADRVGRKFILTVLIGANDLAAGYANNAAGYTTALAAYCAARRAAGWTVVICTILPTTQASNYNTTRNTVNTNIRASWVGLYVDAICDFAADATMGPDAAASNVTYYSDGIHPTDAGQVILETIYRTAVNAL